jgi:hypothetical protein
LLIEHSFDFSSTPFWGFVIVTLCNDLIAL